MSKAKKKIEDIDIFPEEISFDDEELDESLFEKWNYELIWILEELDLQMENLSDKVSKEQEQRLKSINEIMLPYFLENCNDENPIVRKCCEIGLDQIRKRFPEMIPK